MGTPLIVNEAVTCEFLAELAQRNLDLSRTGYYYFQIQSRKKYGGLDQILVRKVVRMDRLVEEIHRATPYRGFYFEGEFVPNSSLAVYITPEPRNTDRAARVVSSTLMLRERGDEDAFFNMPSLYMSECQKCPAQRRLLDIDIDDKSKYAQVMDTLTDLGVVPDMVVETRGGYHVLCYDLPSTAGKPVHDMAKRLGDIDLLKNSMMPLPGTMQGGVEVKYVK